VSVCPGKDLGEIIVMDPLVGIFIAQNAKATMSKVTL